MNYIVSFLLLLKFALSGDVNINNINVNNPNIIYANDYPGTYSSFFSNLDNIFGYQRTDKISATEFSKKDNGYMISSCGITNLAYNKYYDFLMEYPCDNILSRKFIDYSNGFIGKTKKETIIEFLKSVSNNVGLEIIASFYSYIYKCHISYHSMCKSKCFTSCIINVDTKGNCYKINVIHEHNDDNNMYMNNLILPYLVETPHDGYKKIYQSIIIGYAYINITNQN